MKNVILLAKGKKKVYTHYNHGEELFPAIVTVSDSLNRLGDSPRLGLSFMRGDKSAYLEPWSIPSRCRIVQSYRAMRLLEHVHRIQEDTLWAAYLLCDRNLEVEKDLAEKASESSFHLTPAVRFSQAISETGIDNPLDLREKLLDEVKICDEELTKIVCKVLEMDICPDLTELIDEINLGNINKIPEIGQLQEKYSK